MAVELFGKIVLTMVDTDNEKVNETLGFTKANIISDSTSASALKTFARGVNGLTDNAYDSSKVVYEVDLDEASEG